MADFLGVGSAGIDPTGGLPLPFPSATSLQAGALVAAQALSLGGPSDALPPGLMQDPEEEILRRYQTLQRVRKAAGQAAQIAELDAAELRRLEAEAAATLEAAGVPKEAADRVRQLQQEEGQQAPTAAAPAPPPCSEEELKERAGRVMGLGNFWAAQERGEVAVDAEAAVAAAAREAGSFPALAAALRTRLAATTAVEVQEVARVGSQGADQAAAAGAIAAAHGGAGPREESPTFSEHVVID